MSTSDAEPWATLSGYPCPWLWEREGADWPLRATSTRLSCAGLSWHVQWLGRGQGRSTILLLHGTFSSSHSWRRLAPKLAEHYQVLMPDLPGHGWTFGARPEDMAMAGMAEKLLALLEEIGVQPEWVIGHSAGAALAVAMALRARSSADALNGALSADAAAAAAYLKPQGIVSLNGALLPLTGLGGKLYAPAALVLQRLPGLARFGAWRSAHSDVVARLLESTGSQLDPDGVAWYRRLASDPGHVAAVMEMMARWDLPGFARQLPAYEGRLHLVAGSRDTTIPPSDLRRVLALLPQVRCQVLRDLGHLAHEEDPETVAELLLELLAR